jgi:hypothetical protein
MLLKCFSSIIGANNEIVGFQSVQQTQAMYPKVVGQCH